jgi:alkylation response protein AidB-like acyl-CoA dehydrogenase
MNTGTTPSTTSSDGSGQPGLSRRDWRASVADLGPGFSARADAHDADDSFVVENYRELKEYRLFSAAVPTELGGGGATHRELCALLRELARQCGSTALALSMHTHLVATTVWRYQQGHADGP